MAISLTFYAPLRLLFCHAMSFDSLIKRRWELTAETRTQFQFSYFERINDQRMNGGGK